LSIWHITAGVLYVLQKMPTKLEALLDDLSASKTFHLEMGKRMAEADEGRVFPLDLLAAAVLNRSINLIPAFIQLIKSKNMIAAAPLLRLQLDNCIRFHGAWLVEEPHDFATAVMKGEHIGRLKDRNGKKMTDRYLLTCFKEEFPWITNVYEQTCGYIHLSNAHISNIFIGSSTEDDRVREFKIGTGDNFPDDSLHEEAVEAFIAATKAMFHYITGWIETKNGEQVGVANP